MVTKTVGVLLPIPKRKAMLEQVEPESRPPMQHPVEVEDKKLELPVQPSTSSLVEGNCEAPISATFIADGVSKPATEMALTEGTAAMNTVTDAELTKAFDSGQLLSGFRKRWRDRRLDSGASSAASSIFGGSFDENIWDLIQDPTPIRPVPSIVSMQENLLDADEDLLGEQRQSKTQKVDRNLVEVVDVEGSPQGDGDGQLPAVASAASRSTSLNVFKYPWESGRLASIFGDKSLVKPVKTELQPGGRNFISMRLEVGSDATITPKVKLTPNFSGEAGMIKFVRKAEDFTLDTDRERKRTVALKAWWKLLETNLTTNAISSKAAKESSFLARDDYAVEILDATFAIKSPGTICKRLYAMQSFATWCAEQMGCNWQPMDEYLCWRYVRHLQSTGAPATKAASFLEAVRFSWFLLGVQGADQCEKSLRVRGVATQLKAKKAPWKPAAILTIMEVRALHAVLADEKAPKGDRLLVGHYLHLLYSRSRWSDLCQVGHLHIDDTGSYLEVSTRSHKGARSAELRSMLLPIVAPCRGITEDNWVRQYMTVREDLGLETPGDDHCPMIPAPMDPELTRWARRPLTSQEGAEHLRFILGTPKTPERRVSTHSLKSTSMSWTSKFGVTDQVRAVLARHISVVSTATSVYSRDLLSPVLRQFDLMLAAIRSRDFMPDASRSGMLTPSFMHVASVTPFTPQFGGVPRTPVPGSVPPATGAEAADAFEGELREMQEGNADGDAQGVETVEDDADGSVAVAQEAPEEEERLIDSDETSEEASEESTTDSEDVVLEEQVVVPQMVPRDEPKYFINSKSQVIHSAKSEASFACGRKITGSYSRVRELNGIRCSRCFNI